MRIFLLVSIALTLLFFRATAHAADVDKMLAMYHCTYTDTKLTSLLRIYEALATKVDHDPEKGTSTETDFPVVSNLVKFREEKLDFSDDKSKQKLHIPKSDEAKITVQLEDITKNTTSSLNCERLQGSLL